MHHQRAELVKSGDNVCLSINDLDKQNMPRGGDVMVYEKDTTLGQIAEFDAQIQVLDSPNEIKLGALQSSWSDVVLPRAVSLN